ncbi:MAG: cation:proton antiporter [Desulfobacterales bacterium]
MQQPTGKGINLRAYVVIWVLMVLMAFWLKSIHPETAWQKAGLINFSVGFILLISYVTARILKTLKLPMISGYIFTGIVAGPYITEFLSGEMVERLLLINDLALAVIALTAGGKLELKSLKNRASAILLNTVFQSITVFLIVFGFFMLVGNRFEMTRHISPVHLSVMAVLLGVISVARSPSSAIAIISESRASGPFTETVLGVTILIDVLIIVFFTIAMAVSQILLSGKAFLQHEAFVALGIELAVSFIIGAVLGKGLSIYIQHVGRDLILLLLFFAFSVTKVSLWLANVMEANFNASFHLEPLLICMSAGFVVRNFTPSGTPFMSTLDRMSLPIFVLFFTHAGASLNLFSLLLCWPLAVCLVGMRAIGIFISSSIAGMINRDPVSHSNSAWMAYLTQAGVSIGLAQLAGKQFPQIGGYLTTIILAVIAINQVIGPILFKTSLGIVRESKA